MKMEVDEQQMRSGIVMENAALVQPDWDLALKEMPNPKFFVGLRKHRQSSVFANVEKSGDDFVCADSGIQITVHQPCNSLRLQSSDVSTNFLSPVSELRNLHSTSIQSVDVSCSGNLIVSTDASGSLIVSNAMNGTLLRDLKGHIMDVYKCRFFPSGLVVLSAGMDMTVKVWSVETGLCPRTFKGHVMAVTDIAIIGVGREVLSCSHDGTVVKWLCADGSQVEQWKPEAGPCNAIAINKDSELFAVCCEAKKCVVYSVEGPTIATITTDNVPTAVCIEQECDHIVYIGDEEGMVSVYDTKAKSFIYRLQTSRGRVMKIMTRDEGLFIAYRDGSMCCYPRNSSLTNVSCPIYEFTGSDCDPVYDFCFHQKHLFTASRDRILLSFQIRMFNKCLQTSPSRLQIHQQRFKTVKFKPKVAKTHALKTPSMVALDHCDFYYGPMFGKRWPSIRLGLLTPNKYIAVMNTFSNECDTHEELLKSSNTIDLLARIRGKTAAERIEEKKQRVDSCAKKETEIVLKEMDV
ncbi:WD domain, G-beta repeat protein [Cooperia oncophora]